MRKAALVVVIVLALVAVSGATLLWANTVVNSIYGYRSPLKGDPPPTDPVPTPLTSHVVLVVIDGLRLDTSLRMPFLNSLRKQGGQASMVAQPPSTTLPAWTTLISGAAPEINGAPLLDRDYEWIQPLAIDQLFATVDRAGATAGIVGFHWWEKLVPANQLYVRYYVGAEGDNADQDVVDHALKFLVEFEPNLLLVNLRQMELSGRHHGGVSDAYARSALRCDGHLEQLATAMDLRHSVLIVLSSYGHLDAGGHGGDEPVTLTTPFVMVGENVRVGDRDEISAMDVAPTIAALLGMPFPRVTQGQVRTDMLRMDRVDEAEKLVSLASQRVHMGNVYLGSIGRGSVSETAEGDMLVAVSSLQVENYDSAVKLAALAIQQSDYEMATSRHSRIVAERGRRALPLAVVAVVVIWIVWYNRSRETAWSALAALLSAALYHVLFLRQGNVYTFSRIPVGGFSATLEPSLQRAVLATAAGALLLVLKMWHERERSVFNVVVRSHGFAALQLVWIGLLLAACTWWNGYRFTWYLADFAIAYVQLVSLVQAMCVAALAIALPAPMAIAHKLLLFISDHRASGQ
jgi:hypothetical protein